MRSSGEEQPLLPRGGGRGLTTRSGDPESQAAGQPLGSHPAKPAAHVTYKRKPAVPITRIAGFAFALITFLAVMSILVRLTPPPRWHTLIWPWICLLALGGNKTRSRHILYPVYHRLDTSLCRPAKRPWERTQRSSARGSSTTGTRTRSSRGRTRRSRRTAPRRSRPRGCQVTPLPLPLTSAERPPGVPPR